MSVRRRILLVCAASAAAASGGCLRRTIRVTSNPEGAIVRLNDVEIGRTPTTAAFTYYGVYDVRLELDGYEPVVTSREAVAPFYEYPGPDLVAAAIPVEFHKKVEWHFDLVALPATDADKRAAEDELLTRARGLREETAHFQMK